MVTTGKVDDASSARSAILGTEKKSVAGLLTLTRRELTISVLSRDPAENGTSHE
jgi:hypothetical protein